MIVFVFAIAVAFWLEKRKKSNIKQAGAELGQAQLILGLDFTLIFCSFGLSRFGDLACRWIGS